MHLSAGAHGRSRTVVHGAPRCQAAGMHQGAGAHRWWCTVVHGAIRCQAAGMHLGARCTQASVHLLRDSLITHNTTSVPKRPDAPRCTVHLGARRPGCTLVQVHKRPDAPRCTVQYGARRPGCTSVQVHGDPNAPSHGAGAARAPCVTLATMSNSAEHAHHILPRSRLTPSSQSNLSAPSPSLTNALSSCLPWVAGYCSSRSHFGLASVSQ